MRLPNRLGLVVAAVFLPGLAHRLRVAQATGMNEPQSAVREHRETGAREVEPALVRHQVEHQQYAAGAERIAQTREQRAGVEVVEGGDRGDAVEALTREGPARGVGQLELEVRALRRAGARDADHLGREIEREHPLCVRRERMREGAGAAADLERLAARARHAGEQEAVVMAVVIPGVVVQTRQAIEVGLDRAAVRTVIVPMLGPMPARPGSLRELPSRLAAADHLRRGSSPGSRSRPAGPAANRRPLRPQDVLQRSGEQLDAETSKRTAPRERSS